MVKLKKMVSAFRMEWALLLCKRLFWRKGMGTKCMNDHTGTHWTPGVGRFVLTQFSFCFIQLRVLKLAQSWKTMGDLLNTIGSSVGAVGNITVILAIIVYMFAVVGMQIFKEAYSIKSKFKNNEIPRWNFSDFGHSFMVIFRILCGKWIEPLWWTMRATNPAAILFILPAFIIGNFVILNLFLALLLNSFSGGGDDEAEDEEAKKKKRRRRRRRRKGKRSVLTLSVYWEKTRTTFREAGARLDQMTMVKEKISMLTPGHLVQWTTTSWRNPRLTCPIT